MDHASFRRQRPPVVLSLTQKLRLIAAFSRVLASTVFSLFTGLIRGENGARTYARHVMASILRGFLANVPFLELQSIHPACDQTYTQFCKSRQLKPEYEISDSGGNGFWIGSKSASRIIIHFHGGGYAMDISSEHFETWFRIIQDMSRQGVDIAVFFPVYSLTPHASYPTQFQEGVDALSHIINDLGRDPSDIIISGDSAGGNMCISILSHLMHPSPEVAEKSISSPLRGMLLMSPWVSFDINWPSMKKNLLKDIDDLEAVEEFGRVYLNGRNKDNYNEPILAPADWWTNCPVKETFVIAGSDEVFVDSISAWVERFQAAGNEVQFVVAQGEFHIEPFILPLFGDNHETKTEKEIKVWLRSNVK